MATAGRGSETTLYKSISVCLFVGSICSYLDSNKFKFSTNLCQTTAQIGSGESVRSWSCRLGFDSESVQTNDFNTDIHSFPV